jgi:hypothetical protein
MNPDNMLLAIACAASLPSAGLTLRVRQPAKSMPEMTIGAAICITCFALVLTQGAILWLAVALLLSLLVHALAQQKHIRWPLLMLAGVAFLAYLSRSDQLPLGT